MEQRAWWALTSDRTNTHGAIDVPERQPLLLFPSELLLYLQIFRAEWKGWGTSFFVSLVLSLVYLFCVILMFRIVVPELSMILPLMIARVGCTVPGEVA